MAFKFEDQDYYGKCIPGTDRERNGYSDSDFFVTYWDGKSFRTTEYGTTRFAAPTSLPAGAYLDWDSELGREVLAAMLEGVTESKTNAFISAMNDCYRKGARVRIVDPMTRGKNKTSEGATGTVNWLGETRRSQYGTWGGHPTKIGIDLDGETQEWNGKTRPRRVFLDVHQVEPEVRTTRATLSEKLDASLLKWEVMESNDDNRELIHKEWLKYNRR